MQYIYLKPQLQNLLQGERIAFVRQFRRMTQDEVSDKLGLDGENKRRSMARYESGDRKPKENNSLRGEIKYSNYNTLNDAPFIEGKERHEGISFAENHYVECYVIKDNIVVEEGKFMVNFID